MLLIFVLLLVFDASLAWPQTPEPTTMQKVYMAKQVFPGVKTVGVLCRTSGAAKSIQELRLAGNAYQLEFKIYDARDLMELRSSFSKMVQADKIDMVWVVPDDVANQKFGRRFMSEKCVAMKIPLFVPSVEHLREGALFTISKDTEGVPKVFINSKVSELMGFTFSPEIQSKIFLIEY